MCGVAGYVGTPLVAPERVLEALSHRGPDAGGWKDLGEVTLIHTRLAILDLDDRSNQPFPARNARGQLWLSYNGELWNYRELREELEELGYAFGTQSDTEVMAYALLEWGEEILPRLNGMFAMAWWDDDDPDYVRLARDRHGEIPLHYGPTGQGWAFASELKALREMGVRRDGWVFPGTVVRLTREAMTTEIWHEQNLEPLEIDLETAASTLRGLISTGAMERAISDVPVCTLLSGGIDSAAVAYWLREWVDDLTSYVAVLEGTSSRDVRHARETAEALGIELIEVEVPVPSVSDLRAVIEVIEQPNKAQVEIGWACLHLARRMAADGFKVTFSGEGSDELWASYGFAYHALETQGQDWHKYRRDLFLTQHRKNFPRCNKVFMSAGVECRLPFLHPSLVDFALRLPREAVQDGKRRPKAVIQEAFRGLLPDGVVDRPKLAFQDGAGIKAAIAEQIADPKRLYAAEYARAYG